MNAMMPPHDLAARLSDALDAIDRLRARLKADEQRRRAPIAVIGIGCRLPGGVDGPDDFWRLLSDGRDATGDIPRERFDVDAWYDPDPAAPGKMVARRGGFVAGVDRFDPAFFGIAPREVPSMDPQHRMLLEVAWEALEHAGIAPDRLAGSRSGVFVGITTSDYLQLHTRRMDPAAIDAYLTSGNVLNAAPGRVAYILGLRGPSLAIDTACSSSLVAVHTACQSLRSGGCDLALAGGVNAVLAPELFVSFSKWGMLAPDGRCKTFDARADGFARGEGCGVVVLKRVADAVADGDRVLAVIRGSAINQDGASGGLTVPNGTAQADVIRDALADAGVAPAAVHYVEAHGTGTALGDPIEIEALASAYGAGRPADRPLAIGSVKTNLGHLESAAGVAGLIKTVLALHHGEIPPHLHLTRPTPHVAWSALPITVPTRRTPWPEGPGPRLAGVSAFGFSGTNAHVVLESAPSTGDVAGAGGSGHAPGEPAPRIGDVPRSVDRAGQGGPTTVAGPAGPAASPLERPLHAVALSARSAPALRALAERHVAHLGAHPDLSVADIGFTANTGRAHFDHRLAWVGPRADALRADLAAWLDGRPAAGLHAGERDGRPPPRVAFLFTGQGAQHAGMGRGLYDTQPVFRSALERCAELLRPHLARPLLDVLFADPADPDASARIDDTTYSQPALFALGYALAELWRAWGIAPSAVLGHSIGEVTAACVAGAFSLEDGLRLVAERARGMGALPRDGAMAAVFAPEDRVRAAIAPHHGAVAIAALNGPEHVVVSGPAATVDALCARFDTDGIRWRRLQVSHAFHSPMMDPMLDAFERAAGGIAYHAPHLPVLSNVTGSVAAGGDVTTPEYWRRHARSPVRFAEGMAALRARGITAFVEIGPRPTLIALGQRCLPEGEGHWLPSLRRGRDDWAVILDSLATLYAHGASVDWAAFDRPYSRRRLALPTYPFQRQRYWLAAASARAGDRPAANRQFDDVPAAFGAPHRSATGHPLLGDRVGSPQSDAVVFEATLRADRPAFVADHAVAGQVVLPATAYVELALAAATRALEGPSTVEDLAIDRRLVLDRAAARTLQTVVTADGHGAATVDVFSIGLEDAGRWLRHATARIARCGEGAAPNDHDAGAAVSLARARERCRAAVDIPAHYRRFEAWGIAFGPAFRGIVDLWGGEGASLGEVVLPDEAADRDTYAVHPALLDACWQVLFAAWPPGHAGMRDRNGHGGRGDATSTVPDRANDPYLPVGVESVRFFRPAGTRLWSHAVPRGAGAAPGDVCTVDIHLFAPDGTRVGDVRGLVLRRVEAAALAADGPPAGWRDWRDWLYAPRWEPPAAPHDAEGADRGARDGARGGLARADTPDVEGGAAPPEVPAQADPVDLLPALDRLCAAFAAAALDTVGCPLTPGALIEVDTLAGRLGIAPGKERLVARMLEMLAEEGVLRREAGGSWRVGRAPEPGDPATELRSLRAVHPGGQAELALLERCGARLAEVLTGACDPLSLLFPGGSTALLDPLYRDSATARHANALVAEAVAAAAAGMPADRPLRVLEIGAGTGGTTAFILPRLPAERTRYTFTDISAALVAKARAKLADWPWVTFGSLDIERDPEAQGHAPGAFDVIVAANVLHATRDLAATLGHVRRLLAPGGRLVLLEGTAARRWVDLTFGLTDGWWRFADVGLRPAYPLLAPDRWARLLTDCGFGDPSVVRASSDDASALFPQAVITAAAPAESATAHVAVPGAWLILEDAGGVGAALAAAIERHGGRVGRVRARPGAAPGADAGTQTVDPTDPGAVEAALRAVQAQLGVALNGVVHLWSLDAPLAGDADAVAVAAVQGPGSLGALHVAQAIVRSDAAVPPRLWLVTRGSQVVGSDPTASGAPRSDAEAPASPGLAHATLWGMARTIALEHPQLGCTCIDLDPRATDAESAAALAAALAAGGDEDRLALRGGATFVTRLARLAARPPAAAIGPSTPPRGPYRLVTATPGVIESLRWQPAERRPPGPGEVEIRVQATGLNFRDVLNALGAYPGDAGPLGGECVGTVAALGPGVDDLAIGEAVLAVAPGAFASHVTTHRALVVRKPVGLSIDAAATVLVAFMTAAHALREVASLRAGERVLIHAAAGGVGLAAVQVAHRAGAEVFATAGSDAKRAHLRSLGVAHVFSSRAEDFAAAVLDITGGRGVDVVLNALADPFIAPSLAALAHDGRFVEIGKRGIWDAARVAAVRPAAQYRVVDMAAMFTADPVRVGRLVQGLAAEIEAGGLEPLPHQAFAWSETAAAFRIMARGEHIGKLVVRHPAAAVRADATYLITGAFGGLGLLTAEWLVDQGARSLVLVGHRAPSAAVRTRLAALERAGVEVRVEQADVADEAAMRRLVQAIDAEMPSLRGVFHAAGVLDDGALLSQSKGRFARVFAAKAQGAWILHRLTTARPLDHFVLYSSLSAVIGSPGQANHAAANAFMDALAHHRRAQGLPALSVNWGAWSEIGRAARGDVAVRLAARGVGTMAPAEGLAAFAHLVVASTADGTHIPAQIVVSPVDWRRFREAVPAGRAARWSDGLVDAAAVPAAPPAAGRPSPAPPGGHRAIADAPEAAFRRTLAAAPAGRRRALLVGFVRDRARRVIGIEPDQPFDTGRPLHALGLDSLMAVELRNVLGADLALARPLPASLVFDHPSVEALADHLNTVLSAAADAGRPASASAAQSGRGATGGQEPQAAHDFGAAGARQATEAEIEHLSEAQAAELLLAELTAAVSRGEGESTR
ncbi:polyketide synthase [bacterium]|nr:MAG: polyketide synthase [bacterium]